MTAEPQSLGQQASPALVPTSAAWLAGLWDGEGSVGAVRTRANTMKRLTIIPQIQIHMTDRPTMDRVVEMFAAMGFTTTRYRATEKKPHHKDAYHLAVRRTAWVLTAATTLLPYSVTKAPQWRIMRELCELRIDRAGLTDDNNGWLRRGGPPGWAKQYEARELEIAEELYVLNHRLTSAEFAAQGRKELNDARLEYLADSAPDRT